MSNTVRTIHRWTSVLFTLGVFSYMAAMSQLKQGEVPPAWMGILPAGSLLAMFLTGAYMFVLPYVRRTR